MNVSDSTIQSLYKLNGLFFEMNRYVDRLVSVLGVTFVCPTASKILHTEVAHWYSSVADTVNERCLENFNIEVVYPATPSGEETYDNLIDMFEKLLNKTIEFQNSLMATIEVALENKDRLIVVELDKVLLEVNTQVAKALMVRDKAEQYGEDYAGFDDHFPHFFFDRELKGE